MLIYTEYFGMDADFKQRGYICPDLYGSEDVTELIVHCATTLFISILPSKHREENTSHSSHSGNINYMPLPIRRSQVNEG